MHTPRRAGLLVRDKDVGFARHTHTLNQLAPCVHKHNNCNGTECIRHAHRGKCMAYTLIELAAGAFASITFRLVYPNEYDDGTQGETSYKMVRST
jgi:hypothetical protein